MSHFSGQFKGSKKSWSPTNVPWNGSSSDCPAKKMSRSFLYSGTLIVIMSFCRILFQKSGIKCTGVFLYVVPLRRFYTVLFIPLFCRPREKCGILWKAAWLHNVDNIRQKDIKYYALCSVADPDPHVFGPPRSGSTSQRYGSGSGSFYHNAKTERKTLIPTILNFCLWKMM
jgi:hypothetical protein